MGVAGSIFGLHPPSSANQCNFLWYTNDITIAFWYIYWFQIYKKTLSSSSPFLKLSLTRLADFDRLLFLNQSIYQKLKNVMP